MTPYSQIHGSSHGSVSSQVHSPRETTRADENTVGTSAALAIPLIILAVYVNDILKYYQKHIEQRLSNIWVGFKGIFTRPVTDCHKRRIESSRGKWGFNLLAFRKKDRLPTIEDGKNR